jgi:hypothetical protein
MRVRCDMCIFHTPFGESRYANNSLGTTVLIRSKNEIAACHFLTQKNHDTLMCLIQQIGRKRKKASGDDVPVRTNFNDQDSESYHNPSQAFY